ncbi:MAG: hypothetical protein IJE77_02990 [Thermoguttaceae bacterium]|nr:hypothetical protein [Thermoguttaceae bacterium]MBQ9800113.1 hypothetical protein [Thermoguttaceae bacterium]
MSQAAQTPKTPRRPRLLHLRDDCYCSLFVGVRKLCELGLHIYDAKPGSYEECEELYETLYRQIRNQLQAFENYYLKAVEERRRAVAEFDAKNKPNEQDKEI